MCADGGEGYIYVCQCGERLGGEQRESQEWIYANSFYGFEVISKLCGCLLNLTISLALSLEYYSSFSSSVPQGAKENDSNINYHNGLSPVRNFNRVFSI